ncbi:MAG: nucleotidyltransferase family protein [Chloroflexi bacterium]|nr:nucleotidyltransferase family protein [Chloroflexota bacterium]
MKTSPETLVREDILGTLRKRSDIRDKFKVRRMGLFGSFAAGKQEPDSDIDLFVEFAEPTFDNFMGLVFFLEDLFGRKVEILTPAGIQSIRIKHVANEIKRNIVYV